MIWANRVNLGQYGHLRNRKKKKEKKKKKGREGQEEKSQQRVDTAYERKGIRATQSIRPFEALWGEVDHKSKDC